MENMSQGNIAFVVSIILLSVLACAIIALIICAVKCKKGKAVFLAIAAALVVVLTAACIVMLISYNRSKPAKETKLQPLTPEVLRYMDTYFDNAFLNADKKIAQSEENTEISRFGFTYRADTGEFTFDFDMVSVCGKSKNDTVYSQHIAYDNNGMSKGKCIETDIPVVEIDGIPSIRNLEKVGEYLGMVRLPGADILSSEYSSVSVSYDFSDETSDVNNASGYYMLDYGGLHGIDNPELSEMAGHIKILYKVDNDVYVLYTLIASS